MRYYSGQKYNGTKMFYNWVREYISPQARVLNIGAGPATGSPTRVLKGEVASVVGIDIEADVLSNPELDEAYLIRNGHFPVPDESFELAFADFVFEHIEHPAAFLSEVCRVLKPGASVFFRTPNRYHYVAIGSILTPHWVHRLIANRMRGLAKETHEPWPTYYRLNTRLAIWRSAQRAGFTACEFRMVETEPSYLMFLRAIFMLGLFYERMVNRFEWLACFRSSIFGRLIK